MGRLHKFRCHGLLSKLQALQTQQCSSSRLCGQKKGDVTNGLITTMQLCIFSCRMAQCCVILQLHL
jgi:hypothetical protein